MRSIESEIERLTLFMFIMILFLLCLAGCKGNTTYNTTNNITIKCTKYGFMGNGYKSCENLPGPVDTEPVDTDNAKGH